MPVPEYENLDILFIRSNDAYSARIIDSPGGQASIDFSLPFTQIELVEFLTRARRAEQGAVGVERAKDFGGRLFESLFGSSKMWGVLRSSIEQAENNERGLRIRLRLTETPELAIVPWEYLYHKEMERFLVLSAGTPIVRYLEMPERIEPLRIDPPLRILVLISSPSDQPPLDVENEWQKLQEALAFLVEAKHAVVERLTGSDLSSLRQQLRKVPYHVFHFIGHGDFARDQQEGFLWFADSSGSGQRVTATDLAVVLHDHSSMRVAVLNACEGGRAADADPFSGTAQTLVQQGIPGVLAMQFQVSDQAAIALAAEFYAALSDGFPVDAATSEARKAVFALGSNIEWGTPVLYMRAPDGQVFSRSTEETMTDEDSKPRKQQGGLNIGSFNIGGNVGGNVNISEGDISTTQVTGDIVHGDKTAIGSISESSGIAIGQGSSVVVNPWQAARDKLTELPLDDEEKQDAATAIERIETMAEAETEQGAPPDEDKLDRYLRTLEELAPDVVEVVINAITNPGAAVGSGLKTAIKAWREVRK